MKEHINNLIDRLSNYNEKLDKIALFADKKWILIDNEGNQQSYIFERNNDLVMSKNGKVKMGKWKYYPDSNSIKIDRIEDQILLNQAFFDKALMVLKYDGYNNNDLFILADQKQIPDLNLVAYLKRLDYKNKGLETVRLTNGGMLVIENNTIIDIDGVKPNNGFYFDVDLNFLYEFKDGKVYRKILLTSYKCKNNGTTLIVAQRIKGSFYIGDLVFTEDLIPLSSGKCKFGIFNFIEVEDGKIINAW